MNIKRIYHWFLSKFTNTKYLYNNNGQLIKIVNHVKNTIEYVERANLVRPPRKNKFNPNDFIEELIKVEECDDPDNPIKVNLEYNSTVVNPNNEIIFGPINSKIKEHKEKWQNKNNPTKVDTIQNTPKDM